MEEPTKEMLFLEFQELSTSLRNFMAYRITILGFGITILSFLFTNIIEGDSALHQLILQGFMISVMYALTLIISSLTRHMIVFAVRLKEIQQTFSKNGFWIKWKDYLTARKEQGHNESKTHSIYLILQCITVLLLIFIIAYNLRIHAKSEDATDQNVILTLSILYTFTLIFLFFFTRYKLKISNHWEAIKNTWQAIEKEEDIKAHKKTQTD